MINRYFIFDTNTLISAHILANSVSYKALNLARQIGIIACTLETFKEFEISFTRNKFEKYLSYNRRYVDLVEMKSYIEFFIVKQNISICRDPDDDKFLALAVAANASCIVTGDKDLLILNPYENIPILSPAGFLSYFSEFGDSFIVNEPRIIYGDIKSDFQN